MMEANNKQICDKYMSVTCLGQYFVGGVGGIRGKRSVVKPRRE
jgi:hypothetical protein